MDTDNEYIWRRFVQSVKDVFVLTDVLTGEGDVRFRDLAILEEGAAQRCLLLMEKIQGNRSPQVPITFSNMRLWLTGCLKECLEKMGKLK